MSEIQDLLNASTQDMVDDYLIIDDNSREIYVPSGEFCWNCNDDVGTRHRAISGRLVYIPNLKNW